MFIFPSGSPQVSVSTAYQITNSLRFRSISSAFLSRTPGSAGSRTTWTYSAWVKRGAMGSISPLFYAGADSANNFRIQFVATDTLAVTNEVSGVATTLRDTNQVFRDPSAWYHIVVTLDTTQASAGNRLRVYVNSREITSFGSSANPTQNATFPIGNNVEHRISRNSGTNYFDGYQTDINYINGQALTPTSFGEFDSVTGVWKPKDYTGSYGTTGFHLNFADNSANTAAAIGKDISGNGNNWTPSGISLTAGVTYDSMIDSPTMGASGTQPVGNYATFNPISTNTTSSKLLDGNLTLAATTNTDTAIGNFGMSSGKWYWEASTSALGAGGNPAGVNLFNTAVGTNYIFSNTSMVGFRFDADVGSFEFTLNGTTWTSIATGLTSGPYFVYTYSGNATSKILAFNFGQRPFTYTPPTGFRALCTTNLPDSTIVAGNKFMDATLYTGTSANRSITNAGSFRPDLVWIKSRSNNDENVLSDAIRGATNYLVSNGTAAETGSGTRTTSFNSNGFSLGESATVNATGNTFVAWQWQAGSSTVTNTSGTISSQVRANPTTGFSIVTYTGNGSASATVGHGLGVAPRVVLIKTRSATNNWFFYTNIVDGSWDVFNINTTSAKADSTATAPTSSVFSVITAGNNNVNLATYVAYCWAEVPGFSRFGSYTGNGDANGPFIYTGFRPKFVLIKASSITANDWALYDTSRDPSNLSSRYLSPSTSNTEDGAKGTLDILSNGFKLRNTNSSTNSTATYLYMAFAENPFKNSLAR